MLFQVIRVSRRATSSQSTQLYQYITRRAVSTSTPEPEANAMDDHVAFIRTWKPIKNIADAYTMMNALERKYGKIVNARFPKDFEEPTKFQMYSFVYFEQPISHRIPLDGVEFTIPSSGIEKEQHEVSMSDLENILNQSSEYDPDYQFPNMATETQEDRAKVIGGHIRRGGLEFVSQHQHSLYQDTPRAVMQNFLRWGGFHELKPLEKRRTIQAKELFPGRDDVDNIRMRAALQQTAMTLDQPNPNYEQLKPLATKIKKSDEASTSRPSLGALAFGGLQEEAAPKRKGAASPNLVEKLQTSTSTEADASTTKPSPSSLPPSMTTTTTVTSTKSRDSEPSQTSPSRVLPTAEQLAAKEALKKQLDFAKQLKQTLATPYTGRKQAKPSLKQPKRKPQEAVVKELDFDHPDYIPKSLPEPEAEKPGVLKRLWGGLFGNN